MSAVRTNINQFNITVCFHYLGANSLSSIRIGYRPITLPPVEFIFTDHIQYNWNSSLINQLFDINDNIVNTSRIELMIEATNIADKSTTKIIEESIGT